MSNIIIKKNSKKRVKIKRKIKIKKPSIDNLKKKYIQSMDEKEQIAFKIAKEPKMVKKK